MSTLDTRLAVLERRRKQSAAEMSDADLMSIVLQPRYGRIPTAAEVQDGLQRFNAMSDELVMACNARQLAEALYAT